jgi:CRISPR-associated protein Csm5
MNIQRWNLAITPLSPVHLGTGADYDPTGYVIDNGVLYEFDGLAALSVLPEAKRRQLNSILSGRADQDMLLQVQAFFYGNKEVLKGVSRRQIHVSPTIEAFYQERVGHVSQHETGGKKVQNKLEIERSAWNPAKQQPFIPGSGIKGAIRTALLDDLNQGRPLNYSLKRDCQANTKLQQDLMQGSFHTDPLRLVSVADASPNQPEQFATQVRFALNRKKQPVTNDDGNLRQSQAEQQGLYQLLECLPEMMPRAFTGTVEIQRYDSMPSSKSSDKWPAILFDLEQIASASNRFYGTHLNEEMALLKRRGYVDENWSTQLSSLLSEHWLKTALSEKRAFLLRVGRHSGAESVTLNGLRDIKIMMGKGKTQQHLQAKTTWLAGDERQLRTNMLPFGWLLIEAYQSDDELPSWPEHASNHTIRDWRQDILHRHQQQIDHLRKQQQAERMAREAEQRKKAEQEAAEQARKKAEAEETARKQAALEALSVNQKTIHQLNEQLEMLKAQPESLRKVDKINSTLNSLISVAPTWIDLQEREALACFMESYYELVGWHQTGVKANKKKKQEKKKREKISQIRQGQT